MASKFLKLASGELEDCRRDMYPSMLRGHKGGSTGLEDPSSHYFGFVAAGGVSVLRPGLEAIRLSPGMFFSLPGPLRLEGDGEVAVFQRLGYRGLATFGGPVEEDGRLCYIDNCRASILAPPARLGDPCLNLLTFPSHTRQTMHIHPTMRLGVVYLGRGTCLTKNSGNHALLPGMVFAVPAGEPHHFLTEDSPLTVIAYHPDTDLGPTDSSHPMLSRTFTKF
jgi:hypothetical protein